MAHDSAVASEEAAGAPAGIEIRVTPAMIEAGALKVAECDGESESCESIATKVFVEMMEAAR
jgi:hypothetical protein